jgi:multidrug efflux pump subunit AcrB
VPERFPGFTFSFLPADIVSQILNFGAPSPIDVQVRSSDPTVAFEHANRLLARIRQVPGVVDARIQQSRSAPVFAVDIDRTRAQYVGLTTRDVTNSLVVNLAGSGQIAPTYWLNPANGVSYNIVLQTPQYRLDSLSALSNLPIAAPAASGLMPARNSALSCRAITRLAPVGTEDPRWSWGERSRPRRGLAARHRPGVLDRPPRRPASAARRAGSLPAPGPRRWARLERRSPG